MKDKPTLGIILGNRDFFPDSLITAGREELLSVLTELGITPVVLDTAQTKAGAVETWADAQKCAALFDAHRHDIDGILISLPNFGDEKAAVEAIRLSGLQVPILVHAFPDDLQALSPAVRRDAYCGKISVCNNLRQYGYPFAVTRRHTLHPTAAEFRQELERFVRVCAVVNGLRTARIGAVGARPNAFNTTRYSEKLLQQSGISVQTVDLSEILGPAAALADEDARVRERVASIQAYLDTSGVPSAALLRMAKFGVVLDQWMSELAIDATAIQCWNSLQSNLGANVCTLMSMMGERLLPSACEVDVTGAVSMYALQLASGTPSALVDWNNDYGDDENRCVLFHCGNWPRSFYAERPTMEYAPILGSTLGYENTYGVIAGRAPSGPMTYARVSTDDQQGSIRCYVGEGRFVDDPLDTFGSRAVVEIPGLQELMQHICLQGFEHHVAMSRSLTADVLREALGTFMGWDVYRHQG
ncbi:MAG: L-fucose/L-arabinose isomerase family protein [Anaerolineae bacterium]|nr:fucose isomerase [Chloroflexota bacterium]